MIFRDVDVTDLCGEREGGKVDRDTTCKFLSVEVIPVKNQGHVTHLMHNVVSVIIFEASSKYAQVMAWCRQSVYAAPA